MKFSKKDIKLMDASLAEARACGMLPPPSFGGGCVDRDGTPTYTPLAPYEEEELEAIAEVLAKIRGEVLYPADIRLHAMALRVKVKEAARKLAFDRVTTDYMNIIEATGGLK